MPFNPNSMLAKLIEAPVRPGEVRWIGVRPARRAEMVELQEVQLEVGKGLIGDRYSGTNGQRQVTLVESESLSSIASHLGRDRVLANELRRNIVVKGLNLLALKNRQFRIGEAILETSGECHPCSRLEEILGVGGYNAVRGLGGITAQVIQSGRIRVGDLVEPILGAGTGTPL
jgi:MOSC domain-containing protein YiiM